MSAKTKPETWQVAKGERYCFNCNTQVTQDAEVCPSCKKVLFAAGRPSWLAGLLGYLWGGLMGGIAFGIVKVIESIGGFSNRALEMAVFGIVAVGAWHAKKAKLTARGDLAVWKPDASSKSTLLVGGGANRPNKRCPACSEDILLDATTCRFCGRNFSAEEVAQAVQDHEAQMQAAAAAAQQAELEKQKQRHLKRLQSRRTRRLVFGIILTSIGGLFVIAMIAMFFSTPSPGNTRDQQRISAMIIGSLCGLVPLAGGIALLLRTNSAKRLLVAEQNTPPRRTQ